MAGYRFVDRLLAQSIDLFAMGNSNLFLEINALVLLGSNEAARGGSRLPARSNREAVL